MVRLRSRHCLGPASTQVPLEQYQQVRQSLISVNRHICYTECYTGVELEGKLGWTKVTPQWVMTETTSKIPLKGLFVVVDVRDHTTTPQIFYASSVTADTE